MANVIHFEIETKDPEQKIAFYETVFGWEFKKFMDDYWVITTGKEGEKAISGGLMLGTEENLRTINTLAVDSIDDALVNTQKAGGTILSDKMEIPGVGVFAYCKDPEGLMLGILEENQ